jgi:hypothetical protein
MSLLRILISIAWFGFGVRASAIIITAAPAYEVDYLVEGFGLYRRDCPPGYVTHLSKCCDKQNLIVSFIDNETDGCCLADHLTDCGNGVTVCTAQCPQPTSAAGTCPSGYVPHLGIFL